MNVKLYQTHLKQYYYSIDENLIISLYERKSNGKLVLKVENLNEKLYWNAPPRSTVKSRVISFLQEKMKPRAFRKFREDFVELFI